MVSSLPLVLISAVAFFPFVPLLMSYRAHRGWRVGVLESGAGPAAVHQQKGKFTWRLINILASLFMSYCS